MILLFIPFAYAYDMSDVSLVVDEMNDKPRFINMSKEFGDCFTLYAGTSQYNLEVDDMFELTDNTCSESLTVSEACFDSVMEPALSKDYSAALEHGFSCVSFKQKFSFLRKYFGKCLRSSECRHYLFKYF